MVVLYKPIVILTTTCDRGILEDEGKVSGYVWGGRKWAEKLKSNFPYLKVNRQFLKLRNHKIATYTIN